MTALHCDSRTETALERFREDGALRTWPGQISGGPCQADRERQPVGAVTDACGDGNGPCRHWNVGNGDPAVFAAALAAIQASADGCNPGGGHVNPVN
ncbi:hypothetical protein [Labilithrix luteola]|nr:hypothetical protein [Labilithrix luteola]